MAKLVSPLFSQRAHGKLAQKIVYHTKNNLSYVRSFHRPKKEISLKQCNQRSLYALLTAHWQCLTDEQRKNWTVLSRKARLPITPFNFFIHEAIKNLYEYHGLVLYYSMNEVDLDVVYDLSNNNFHGNIVLVEESPCPLHIPSFYNKFGNALQFDELGGLLYLSDNPKFNLPTSFTIECWIKPVFFGTPATIFCRWANWSYWFAFGFRDLGFWVYMKNVDSWEFNSNMHAVILDVWQHVAVTLKSPEHLLSFYHNGELSESAVSPIFCDFTNAGIRVGSFVGFGLGSPYFGFLDDFRIYNRTLSDVEIKKHYDIMRLNKKRQLLF